MADKTEEIPSNGKTISPENNNKTKDNDLSLRERLKSCLKRCHRGLRSGLRWLWKDLRSPHLIWLKVIFLLQSASLVTLYPYLNIHMRSLGLGLEDAAVVNGEVDTV